MNIRFYGPVTIPVGVEFAIDGIEDAGGNPNDTTICTMGWIDVSPSFDVPDQSRFGCRRCELGGQTEFGKEGRTVVVRKSVVGVVNVGKYRVRIPVECNADALFYSQSGIVPASYWNICGTGNLDATKAYYFRVASGTTVDCLVCHADFNCSGIVSVQDIFDFLTAWFNGDPSADYNHDPQHLVSIQDLFDFLTDWFTGC